MLGAKDETICLIVISALLVLFTLLVIEFSTLSVQEISVTMLEMICMVSCTQILFGSFISSYILFIEKKTNLYNEADNFKVSNFSKYLSLP